MTATTFCAPLTTLWPAPCRKELDALQFVKQLRKQAAGLGIDEEMLKGLSMSASGGEKKRTRLCKWRYLSRNLPFWTRRTGS